MRVGVSICQMSLFIYMLDRPAWEWLTTQIIRCKNRKDAKVVFAYGNTKPLPTLGTFTALVMCTDTNVTVEADFVVILYTM